MVAMTTVGDDHDIDVGSQRAPPADRRAAADDLVVGMGSDHDEAAPGRYRGLVDGS